MEGGDAEGDCKFFSFPFYSRRTKARETKWKAGMVKEFVGSLRFGS